MRKSATARKQQGEVSGSSPKVIPKEKEQHQGRPSIEERDRPISWGSATEVPFAPLSWDRKGLDNGEGPCRP